MNIKKKIFPKIIIDAKILLFFFNFFSFISYYGADSSHYLNWVIYFKSGNIDVLSSYSKQKMVYLYYMVLWIRLNIWIY